MLLKVQVPEKDVIDLTQPDYMFKVTFEHGHVAYCMKIEMAQDGIYMYISPRYMQSFSTGMIKKVEVIKNRET